MKPQKLLLIVYILLSVTVSCKKNMGQQEPLPAAVPSVPQGYEEIIALNREMAEILEQVYQNDSAYQEVNAAIYSGYYEDERVLLKDLLFPEMSALYNTKEFRQYMVDTGIFRRVFCEIIERGKYLLIKQKLNFHDSGRVVPLPSVLSNAVRYSPESASDILSEKTGVSIYFPYSENFADATINDGVSPGSKLARIMKPAIAATDRDADSVTGREPYICPSGVKKICYRDVIVHDGFAQSKPTHIVDAGATPKSTDTFETPKPSMVNRVYHGWSRLTKQMDNLISLTGNGGGAEIKICRINGYLKIQDEQVDNFAGDLVTVFYTRGEISSKKWKRVYSVWDPNWNYQDTEQVYAVYEEDTKGEKTLSGSLTTTLNLPGKPSPGKVKGEIGFKVSVLTQDEIITQRNVDRNSFFNTRGINQGWGFMADPEDFLSGNIDWPVFDGGTVWGFTMPYRVY